MKSELQEIADQWKAEANRLGFSLTGLCPAIEPTGFAPLLEWIQSGYAGEMHYFASRQEAYRHPQHVLPGVRSLLMLGFPYRTEEPQVAEGQAGRIARYAWGTSDYHDLIHCRLKSLARWLEKKRPGVAVRGVVDSAPLMEREFASLAGLGWIGKNTLLLNKAQGSYFFLAALLTDLELPVDTPHASQHCGTCRRCLDACPTQAFPSPGVLDASRCISYLTIEHRSPIPHELREHMGAWVFGCDVCQDVCPWNRRAPVTEEIALQPQATNNPLDLIALMQVDEATFRTLFRHTPLWRSKRRGILRNAAIALGNQRCETAVPVLITAINDVEPLIRGAAAWALGKIGTAAATAALQARLSDETDIQVQEEIRQSLQFLN